MTVHVDSEMTVYVGSEMSVHLDSERVASAWEKVASAFYSKVLLPVSHPLVGLY